MREFQKTTVRIFLLLLIVTIIIACAGGAKSVGYGNSDPEVSDGTVSDPGTTESSITPPADTSTDSPAEAPGVSDSKDKSSADDAIEAKKDAAGAASAPPSEGLKNAEISSAETDKLMFYEEESDFSDSTPAPSRGGSGSSGSAPSESGLKAGYSDDNRQFNYFVNFLNEFKDVPHLPLDISERILIYLKDASGMSIPNADITIKSGGVIISTGLTLADGSFRFFPSLYDSNINEFEVNAEDPASGRKAGDQFSRNGRRQIDLVLNTKRIIKENIPLDILFILDTTGSMGEEIQRLKATIQLIHLNLSSLSAKPLLRFGLVLYKDDGGEDYRTQIVPLTENLEHFQNELNSVEAYGGGDTPEDLQAALDDSIRQIEWNKDGVRLAFIITDAPPHLDYGQEYDYTDAVIDAKKMGIKIHSVGTGGLPLEGEYILRQISQFTSGRYIFLTYGESGESAGGTVGSVSHHTGANFQTDKLESIIIRFAKEELSQLSDKPLESDNPYFQANLIAAEKKEETLDTLFGMAMEQLKDFSTYSIGRDTSTAVVPFDFNPENLGLDAEYFTERLTLSVESAGLFKLVARKDIQKILEEQNLQLSGITEGENAAKIGKILNAETLITGNLFRKDKTFELFLRLVRVETGEILSVTRSVIDEKLGIR